MANLSEQLGLAMCTGIDLRSNTAFDYTKAPANSYTAHWSAGLPNKQVIVFIDGTNGLVICRGGAKAVTVAWPAWLQTQINASVYPRIVHYQGTNSFIIYMAQLHGGSFNTVRYCVFDSDTDTFGAELTFTTTVVGLSIAASTVKAYAVSGSGIMFAVGRTDAPIAGTNVCQLLTLASPGAAATSRALLANDASYLTGSADTNNLLCGKVGSLFAAILVKYNSGTGACSTTPYTTSGVIDSAYTARAAILSPLGDSNVYLPQFAGSTLVNFVGAGGLSYTTPDFITLTASGYPVDIKSQLIEFGADQYYGRVSGGGATISLYTLVAAGISSVPQDYKAPKVSPSDNNSYLNCFTPGEIIFSGSVYMTPRLLTPIS
jgi:hypothetical protein